MDIHGRYDNVSSVNFTSSFPGVTAFRSEVLTIYAAGPTTVDP